VPFLSALRGAPALALVLALHAHAQSTEPTRLPPVAVTANPLGSDLFDLVAPVSVLSGAKLDLDMQPTLGELVNTLPGINSSYYGPNASRPVIRGLDGDRVQILQNGLASFDASGTSVDHAVGLDTLTVRRVEVVRGPATLLYGPTAIGGVVNVIDNRIPSERLEGVAGAADGRYASPATERAASGFVELGTQQGLQFHIDGFKRLTDDLRIPGYAYSPQLRATLPPDDQGPAGTLLNSASNSDGGSFGAAYVGSRSFAGASYTQFDSTYGTVAEPDVTIRMKQQRLDAAAQWREPASAIKSVDVKIAGSRYEHTEFEGSEAGTTFKNDGWQVRLDVVHNPLGAFEGAFGVQTLDFEFSALGEEGFLPKTRTRSAAAFVYEETRIDAWKLSLGARYDYTRVGADEDPGFGPALTRAFNSGAVSLGATYRLSSQYSLVGSATYTARPPNYQELFADGPHVATGIVEVGDRDLGLERSMGFDFAIRRRGDGWSGSVTAFYNRFSSYITLYDTPLIDPATELPIYAYRQGAAQFYGLEAEATFALGDYGPGRFDLELQADYLWAANTDLVQPLPRISPARFGASLVYTADGWNARLDLFRVQAQDRVAPNELPTDGYTMVNAAVYWTMTRDRYGLTAFLKATNLLDEDARNHVSFLANVAPMAARGVTVGIRGTF
jgi:iron complex outermembrane receptor protein